MRNFIAVVLITVSIYSCTEKQTHQVENEMTSTFVKLPADLTNIEDSVFSQLDAWLSDAKIIGVSEGEHGMNEGMDFRNSLIKHLVSTSQIQVIAFETGMLESRLVNQYIHGKDLNIDSVLTRGICYNFGDFEQNRELFVWLRKINASRRAEKQVHFYGFDMSGNASNPWIDNASYALKELMAYLKVVDQEIYKEMHPNAESFYRYLNIPEPEGDNENSLLDLKEAERKELDHLVDQLGNVLIDKKMQYIAIKGEEEYDWAVRMINASKQNITFLKGYLLANKDQSSREQFMLENLKWIREREENKKILLFAHLAHLAKDISRPDQDGKETQPENMFGELLAKEFGNNYQVIGNLFSYLDYYNSVDSVAVNSFPERLKKRYKESNFCLKVDRTDSIFLEHQTFSIPFRGNWMMTPAKGVDIILYTEKQHFFYKED